MREQDFWVLPCKENPRGWVIYTRDGLEILVEVAEGMITYHSAALSEKHKEYFENNVLTNYQKI